MTMKEFMKEVLEGVKVLKGWRNIEVLPEIEEKIAILKAAVAAAEGEIEAKSVVAAMKRVVPTYRSPEEVNAKAGQAEEMKMQKEPAPV